jgi:hypothetical protein
VALAHVSAVHDLACQLSLRRKANYVLVERRQDLPDIVTALKQGSDAGIVEIKVVRRS